MLQSLCDFFQGFGVISVNEILDVFDQLSIDVFILKAFQN
jgi:hypothetical protein